MITYRVHVYSPIEMVFRVYQRRVHVRTIDNLQFQPVKIVTNRLAEFTKLAICIAEDIALLSPFDRK